MSFALADVDGNGTLDLYVATHRGEDARDTGAWMPLFDEARRAYIVPFTLRNRFTLAADGGLLEFGEPDQLYLNDGRGHFSPAPWIGGRFLDEAGKPLASEPLDWGVGVVFRDLNRDGKPDLIVSNDEWTPDRIFLNLGEGRFRAVPTSQFPLGASLSRGVDVADVNGDGELDIWIAEQRGEDLAERRAEVARAPATPRGRPSAVSTGGSGAQCAGGKECPWLLGGPCMDLRACHHGANLRSNLRRPRP
jgi:hypothetical protein